MLTSQKTHFNPDAANPAKDIDEQVRKALSSGKSLYNLDVQLLEELKPDLVLTQSLCDVCSIDLMTVERVCAKMSHDVTVLDLNPKNLEQVLTDIERIGSACGCEEAGKQVTAALHARIANATKACLKTTSSAPNVCFMEWTDPVFVGGHWTPEIIEASGGLHPLNGTGCKSVTKTDEELTMSDFDILLICPCGMNLEQTEKLVKNILADPKRGPWFLNLRAVKEDQVYLIDGNEMFNRPGPRLVDCMEFCVQVVIAYHDGKRLPKMESFPWRKWHKE